MIMVSPQLDDGYLRIAHEIVEQLAKLNLSSYEWRTLWVLWRKTWGWQQKIDKISITQFQKATGLKRRHQARALKALIDKNIVTCIGDSYIYKYSFQKDYTKWKTVTYRGDKGKTVTYKGDSPSPIKVTKPSPIKVPTKDNKETIQKKEGVLTLIRTIIEEYKRLKGYDKQPDWDKNHYARWTKAAKELYEIAGEGEWLKAMKWMSEQPYEWTLGTVIKKLPDFRAAKDKPRFVQP